MHNFATHTYNVYKNVLSRKRLGFEFLMEDQSFRMSRLYFRDTVTNYYFVLMVSERPHKQSSNAAVYIYSVDEAGKSIMPVKFRYAAYFSSNPNHIIKSKYSKNRTTSHPTNKDALTCAKKIKSKIMYDVMNA